MYYYMAIQMGASSCGPGGRVAGPRGRPASSWGEAGEASRCALLLLALLLLALPVLAAAAASLHGAACYATKVPVIDRADVSRTCRCSSSW